MTHSSASTTPPSHWTSWGQWLALLTMTVDHLIRYLLPESWDLGWAGSSIGRIAFPLFAAMVAWHGLFNTRNPLGYAKRILIIGLVAQLPYMLMPRSSDAFILNVCFTLASGLAIGSLIRLGWQHYRQRTRSTTTLTLSALLLATGFYTLGFRVEYQHNGLLLVPLFMLAMHLLSQSHHRLRLLGSLPLLWIAGQMNSSLLAKSFTLATSIMLLLLAAGAAQRIPSPKIQMPRRLWLAWYPGHFALIAMWLGVNSHL